MLEIIIILALLPFAIAVLIGMAATGYLVIAATWRWMLFVAASLVAVASLVMTGDSWATILLSLFAIFVLVWILDDSTEPVKPHQD